MEDAGWYEHCPVYFVFLMLAQLQAAPTDDVIKNSASPDIGEALFMIGSLAGCSNLVSIISRGLRGLRGLRVLRGLRDLRDLRGLRGYVAYWLTRLTWLT